MTLKLYYHPFSSFCMKVLIALYELDVPFEPILVDLGDQKQREAFYKIWPIGKFPVLRDEARDWLVPESSIIIEYLGQHYPGKTQLIPTDPDAARRTRMSDRFYDLHVHMAMQRIVADRLRPAGRNDPFGVAQARAQLAVALDMVETDMRTKAWAMGDAFSMADCAAAPALHYVNRISPLEGSHKNTAAYLERLRARPSFARVLKEAEPYWALFPK